MRREIDTAGTLPRGEFHPSLHAASAVEQYVTAIAREQMDSAGVTLRDVGFRDEGDFTDVLVQVVGAEQLASGWREQEQQLVVDEREVRRRVEEFIARLLEVRRRSAAALSMSQPGGPATFGEREETNGVHLSDPAVTQFIQLNRNAIDPFFLRGVKNIGASSTFRDLLLKRARDFWADRTGQAVPASP